MTLEAGRPIDPGEVDSVIPRCGVARVGERCQPARSPAEGRGMASGYPGPYSALASKNAI